MQYVRTRLGALWLLLLLARVLLPEAAVLRLHAHHHTHHAPLTVAAATRASKATAVSEQHQHCHTEQLFNAAFTPALPPVLPLPLVVAGYPIYPSKGVTCPARHLLPGAALRGPPLA